MFFRKKKKPPPKVKSKLNVPEDFWVKCPSCGVILPNPDLVANAKVCPKCGHHFRMGAYEYANLLFDNGIEREIGANLETVNLLNFPNYTEKIAKYERIHNLKDSSVAGIGRIHGRKVIGFFTDFAFLGGSMGSVFGEKFYRAAKESRSKKLPLIAVLFSGGGARMHEGIFSLMQMVKTTVGVLELERRGVPYITVLGNPTMGGVMASFAALGDVIIAEPDALIGFAGPRVIKQTIGQDLPPGFQRSEFQLKHGQVDMVVDRRNMKRTIHRLLEIMEASL
ncbi:MAG: acetyl-CoA carboxylase carboxyl transferase subunit beta [Thermotogae bacterium]|nr:acetyl-CoA carboxylase carboxyl transferase subunit beta [Thermotogota bacterium]